MNLRNTIDPEALLPTMEGIIFKLAHKTSETYGVPFEECRREAFYAYVKACATFDPSRGTKIASWIYHEVWCQLKDVVMLRCQDPHDFVEVNDDILGDTAPPTSEFRETMEDLMFGLSSAARDILHLLLDTPQDLIADVPSPKQLMARVREHLHEQGYTWAKLDRAKKEIQAALLAEGIISKGCVT